MAQNTYITLQMEEIDGSVIRNLERLNQWQGKDKKMPVERRRASVQYGWCLLKAYCWTQATGILEAADIDEVAKIDGFADALLAAGYAKNVEKSPQIDGVARNRVLEIERFSPENIAKKNKLVIDSQRKMIERRVAYKERPVHKKTDTHPASQYSSINTIQYNNDKRYNNSSFHSRYDISEVENCGLDTRSQAPLLASSENESERHSELTAKICESSNGQMAHALTVSNTSEFKQWAEQAKGVRTIDSLRTTLDGQKRILELVSEYEGAHQQQTEEDDIPF